MDIHKEVEALLPLVQKPSRYIGGELNLRGKDPNETLVRVVLAFPEVYEIGMSHLGIKILYHVINSIDDTLADRVFAPWVDMEALLRKEEIPLWGLETKLPLVDFDVIGFSLMHELMYTNVLTILDLGKISLTSKERNDPAPLVLAGGPCATNPEPLAPFIDAFVIGEGEEVILEIVDRLKRAKHGGLSREKRLRELSALPGVYVPAFYRPIRGDKGKYAGLEPLSPDLPMPIHRRWPPTLTNDAYPETPIIPLSRIVQDRLDVELFRGCTRGCRFCHAGFFYRPVRERETAAVIQQVRQGIACTGWDEFGLLSLSTSDYTNIEPLLAALKEDLLKMRVSCSLPSLRADNFSIGLAGMVSDIKRTGLTFAPEAGTERLRRVINKEIPREEILETARTAYRKGWHLIKCYFMVGLPTETWRDIEGLVDLSLSIYGEARRAGKNNRLNVSVGAFVPKPHTPFQWEPFAEKAELEEKVAFIKGHLQKRGIKVKWHDVGASWIEALLSRGGRRMGQVIQEAWSLGCRFDEWTEHLSLSTWREALHRCGIDSTEYLRERGESEILPWDHIDIFVNKKFLLRERHRARLAKAASDCRWNRCHGCGIPGAPDDNILAKKVRLPVESSVPLDTASPKAVSTLVRYRLIFQKGRPVRFLSHLDTLQLFMRALRTSGLPLHYTQGHTPRPKISAGPPLPTGVVGNNEVFDIFLTHDVDAHIIPSLSKTLPNGLVIVDAFPVPATSPSPTSILLWGRYRVLLPEEAAPLESVMRANVVEFARLPSFLVTLSRGGSTRTVELKEAVRDLRVDSGPPLSLSFLAKVLDPSGNTASPLLVLQELFGLDSPFLSRSRIDRSDLLTADLRPIQRRSSPAP